MKRILFFVFLISLFLVLFCIYSSAAVYEGRAIDEDYILNRDESNDEGFVDPEFELAGYYKLRYRLDTDTGVLRIFIDPDYASKPQKMLNYAKAEWVPWTKDHLRPYIQTVIIEEGILSVGRFSFWQCENLREVYIPHSVLRIDQSTFYECPKLKTIYYAGTREDFQALVEYQDLRNSYTGGVTEVKAIDLIQYGFSVRVRYINQDGEYFRDFTVGGYFLNDQYVIEPDVMEGLTYVGKVKPDTLLGKIKAFFQKKQPENSYVGVFKKDNSGIIYEFEYYCEHKYEFADPTKICSNACIYCGCANPVFEDEHQFVIKKNVEGGFFKDREMEKKCSVCDLTRSEYKQALWVNAAILSSFVVIFLAVVTGITLPIVFHHKKKSKEKELSW